MCRITNPSMDSNPWILKTKLIEISWLRNHFKWFEINYPMNTYPMDTYPVDTYTVY